MDVYYVTTNDGKFREAQHVLGPNLKRKKIELLEIQSISTEDVAREKAKSAYRILKKPVIVEDTGLHLKALGGFPGALSKWMETRMSNRQICRLLDGKDRSAYAETSIAFYNGKKMIVLSGRINGTIAQNPRGHEGWGWDPIFIAKGMRKTFAQISIGEKTAISHRGKALKKIWRYLKDFD